MHHHQNKMRCNAIWSCISIASQLGYLYAIDILRPNAPGSCHSAMKLSVRSPLHMRAVCSTRVPLTCSLVAPGLDDQVRSNASLTNWKAVTRHIALLNAFSLNSSTNVTMLTASNLDGLNRVVRRYIHTSACQHSHRHAQTG